MNGRQLAYLVTGAYLLRRLWRYLLISPSLEHQTIRSALSSEELRQFLPTFLSQDSQKAFIEELKYFLTSQARPFYTSAWADTATLFQGDGLKGLAIINLPDPTIKSGSALLLSNTCDMDPSNRRLFDSSLTYAPIFSLQRYLGVLLTQVSKERINVHETDIRQQLITQIFFLPQGGNLPEDSIVFLDRIVSAPSRTIDLDKVPQNRLFTLSDFGAWLLALKLSIHFCRIRDRVDRNAGKIM